MFSKRKPLKHAGASVYLMLLPAMILLAVTSIYPFIWIFRYIFYDYNGYTAYYIGFDNIKRAFTNDPIFWQSVLHTIEYSFWKILIIIPLSLIVAVMLMRKLRGSTFFQTLFFVPTVISAAVYSLIFYFIFTPYNGILNAMLKAIGANGSTDWLGNPFYTMFSIIVVAIWGGFGNYMTLFMAGLANIPQDVYESSKIDGANQTQDFFYITLPMLAPYLKVVLMLAITTALSDYESIMVLTNGGPNNRSEVMFLYIYQLMFGSGNMTIQKQIGYGSLLGVVSSLIIGIITVVFLRVSKKLDEVY